MKLIKNTIIVILSLVIGFMGLVFLITHSGSLNFVKKNHVKKLAQEYVAEKYPDYKADFFTVHFDWKPNVYLVTYGDRNDTRQLTYDHTGEKLSHDDYRRDVSYNYLAEYREKIKTTLEDTVSQQIRKVYYLTVDAIMDEELLYQMHERGESIKEPVDCTFGFSRHADEDILSKIQFAEIIITTRKIIETSGFPISKLEFSYSYDKNAPAYRLTWNENMSSMNAEQLSELIQS